MPQVEHTTHIYAPAHLVFGFIANQPERQSEWWKPIELQQRITPAPTQVGSIARYVYNMMGVRLKGEHEVIALREDEYLKVKTLSGIDSTFEFFFKSVKEGTQLTIRVNYKLPGALVGQLLNRIAIEQKNEADLRAGLENLKKLIEAPVGV
ncbi:MAG: SRPBCC family protein [Anaerolineae bacterium]|nr:SRPBCC family protein [Anaerolineae bacterium]MBN8619368.1 SRPBCC family protein [Anaerolineae bacterium]